MGRTEDKNFKRSFESTCSLGRILGTISAASPNSLPRDGGETFRLEKRALLNIDLNVEPTEYDGSTSESPAGGNCEEIRPPGLNNDGILSHWSGGEGNGERGAKIVADSGVEKDRKIRGWNTLLEVAKHALLEHEQNRRIKGGEFRNPKRGTSHDSGLGPDLTRKKTRRIFAHETAAAPAVVRSTRGRALAMPNKYKDSVLDAAAMAEAELPRHNRSGKSAAVRKSR